MKSKTTAILLCFFLGFLGIHWFYLRRPGLGVLYLLTGGLLGIGTLVNFIQLLCMSDETFNTKYNRQRSIIYRLWVWKSPDLLFYTRFKTYNRMIRVFYAVMAMFAIILVSCSSSSYNQATVDNLIEKIDKLGEDQSPSKADYQTAIEQLNYAFDIIEKSGNPEKFAEENEKMTESIGALTSFVMMGQYDEDCPESVKKDIKALRTRAEKLGK